MSFDDCDLTAEDKARLDFILAHSGPEPTPEEREGFERSLEQLRIQAAQQSLEWHENLLNEVRICRSASPAAPERKALTHCRYVYLMRAEEGDYKIGESRHPRRRRAQVQRDEGRKVKLITQYPTVVARRLEKTLHRHFWHVHLRDEWFKIPERVTTPIAAFWAIASILEDHVLALEDWRLHETINHIKLNM